MIIALWILSLCYVFVSGFTFTLALPQVKKSKVAFVAALFWPLFIELVLDEDMKQEEIKRARFREAGYYD